MRKPLVAALLVTTPLIAACADNNASTDADDPRAITVTSTDDKCELSAVEAPAGTLTFNVTNEGSKVTEFYLLGSDGLRILGEVENIGPQLSRQLVVNAPEGSFYTACKPGMKGDGIRAGFAVTASSDQPAVNADTQELIDQALVNYKAYVKDQADQLVTKTEEFVALYVAGKDDEARELYPVARMHWERIETVAESFGDLDPMMDAREADLEPGQEWTGWHRIEKDLWPPAKGYKALTSEQRKFYADDLMANTNTLNERIQELTLTVDQIANGSIGLLEEVAAGKVTGEEEFWSHTDLWDFQANVDGARVAFEGVQPIVEAKDAALAETLSGKFAELQTLLDSHKTSTGFTLYDELSKDEVQALSNAVNALSEPLSKLTAVVLS